MSATCPGTGRRTFRGFPDDTDRCPVCDRVAYVRQDGTTGAHVPTRWWQRQQERETPARLAQSSGATGGPACVSDCAKESR